MTIDPKAPYPSVIAVSEAFGRQALKPSEVVYAQLVRIAKLDPALGSYQAVYAEDALKAAKTADAAIASGHRIGPFHGIPFALKDIFDVSGRVTACGCLAMQNRISRRTGTIVRRLIAAGGILIGKTKTVECALGGWGTNQHMGTPLNPWDLAEARVPGGSSAGSGVAVASGLASCATGTDTGGSVRLPAAYCGLAGLKVSKGYLPTDGIYPLSYTLDTPGPMARSVADVALMLEVMRGTEGWAIDRDLQQGCGMFAFEAAAVSGLKLGIIADSERQVCDPEVLKSYDSAVELLAGLGAQIAVFTAPDRYSDMADANGAITIFEGYSQNKALYDVPQNPMDEDVRKRMLTGRAMTTETHALNLLQQTTVQARFRVSMEGFDALLTPTLTEAAPRLSEIDQDVSPGHFTRPFNYLDMAALAVPMMPTRRGLPTSLQIVARDGHEPLTLQIGAALEAALGAPQHPDLEAL
jgi:aspartyl-tRNA(Asn)/glutamyl-tRNA(Gln) amidotransferase subunit A